MVFLAGERAYKLKRAVKFTYLDFRALEARRAGCETEIAINRRTAPDIYLGIMPVLRNEDGTLCLGELMSLDSSGAGEVPENAVDWLTVMRRFDSAGLFDRLVREDQLDRRMVERLADTIAGFHDRAEITMEFGGSKGMEAAISGGRAEIQRYVPGLLDPDIVERFARAMERALCEAGPLLDQRCAEGRVRHCHGDLHLRNICLVDGAPTLFDAIEFSRSIACIDVLYDVAFAVMDLEFRDRRDLANALINRYLARHPEDYDGLGALPLFLASRASIRCHTSASAAAGQPDPRARGGLELDAARYLNLGLDFFHAEAPALVAVGGLSGSGKSSAARNMAPKIGRAPGAVVLRSDVTRKVLCGVAPEDHLPESAYDAKTTRRVYADLYQNASMALRAGYWVILDAVFGDAGDRAAAASLAAQENCPFHGIWLTAPKGVLRDRIAGRRQDASDATVEVLEQQTARPLGNVEWAGIDSSGSAGATADQALAAIGR